MAHENSMTAQTADGQWINFKSVHRGVQMTADEAFNRAVKTGRNLGTFQTKEAAISAAKARSSSFDPSGEIE